VKITSFEWAMATDVPLRKVTYFRLRRHHLLQRAPRDGAVRVIEDILGLIAQGALNYNLSLFDMLDGEAKEMLHEELEGLKKFTGFQIDVELASE
jgi:hypothetical protein